MKPIIGNEEHQRAREAHREAVVLNELKVALGYPASTSDQAVQQNLLGVSLTIIDGYLLRFLRSKHLSVAETVAKLKRRRVFEHSLPTISVTSAVVAALRSGKLELIGEDKKGRPILYLNVAAITHPTLDLTEMQRLLLILLEFMQAKCMAKLSAWTPSAVSPQDPLSSPEFTLLINEANTAWPLHECFMQHVNTMLTMLSKYYPMLLGSVLIVGASFEVRQGFKVALYNSAEEVRNRVFMLEAAELPRFVEPAVIPTELNGERVAVGSAMNFSEAVLRHWFMLTSELEKERGQMGKYTAVGQEASSVSASSQRGGSDVEDQAVVKRPLFVPLSHFRESQDQITQHRLAMQMEHLCSQVSPSLAPAKLRQTHSTMHAPPPSSTAAASAVPAEAKANGHYNKKEATDLPPQQDADDGLCSALSEDEVDEENGNGERNGPAPFQESMRRGTAAEQPLRLPNDSRSEPQSDATPVKSPVWEVTPNGTLNGHDEPTLFSPTEIEDLRRHPDQAISALQGERYRRQLAEQQLLFTDFGVALDLRNASLVEQQLAGLHQDVNVVVAEILLKAETAAKLQKQPPTLSQLLDLTLTALEGAIGVPTSVPGMSLAQPSEREPPNTSCCPFM